METRGRSSFECYIFAKMDFLETHYSITGMLMLWSLSAGRYWREMAAKWVSVDVQCVRVIFVMSCSLFFPLLAVCSGGVVLGGFRNSFSISVLLTFRKCHQPAFLGLTPQLRPNVTSQTL